MMRSLAMLSLVLILAASAMAHEPDPEPATKQTVVLTWEGALYGTADDAFESPVALASAAGDELVVADLDPPALRVFRQKEGRWAQARRVDLPAPALALVAQETRYVVSLRETGALYGIDRTTWALRQLALPRAFFAASLAVENAEVLLAHDQAAHRVIRLSTAGEVLDSVEVDPGLRALVPGAGGFLGMLPARSLALRYSWSEGDPAHVDLSGAAPRDAWPASAVAADRGAFWLLDRHGGRIQLVAENGRVIGTGSRRGWREGLLYYPSALSPLGADRLAVADQGNGRVQIFRIALEEIESP